MLRPLVFAFALIVSASAVQAQSQDAQVTFTETSTGGRLIVVPMAHLPSAGFVAVHDSTLLSKQDPFGSVLGISAALPAGTHYNITVMLGPVNGNNKAFTTNATDTIIAMPHKDSNNNGVYDFITSAGADDGPFTDGAHATQTFAGNIVIASAQVTRSSMVIAANQNTDGKTYKIAWVDLSAPGFVALHDGTLLSAQDPFGSVVAISALLPPGLAKDVTVTFGKDINGGTHTGPLAKSQLLIAMPHKDSNTNGRYDFITSKGADDGPFAGSAQTFAGNINIATTQATLVGGYGQGGTGTSATGNSQTSSQTGGSQYASSGTTKGSPALEVTLILAALGALAVMGRRP